MRSKAFSIYAVVVVLTVNWFVDRSLEKVSMVKVLRSSTTKGNAVKVSIL